MEWIQQTIASLLLAFSSMGMMFGAPTTGANYIANTLKLPNILSADCIGTNGSGLVQVGTCTGGTGSNAFQIATTSDIAISQVAYITKVGGLTTLGSVATGTVSSSGGITTTAGRSVLGGALSIACDVASNLVPGCLSSSDWTTFNLKESALTFLFPLIRSTNTVSFGGLSTSSPWTTSGLAYAVNNNTLSTVATGTVASGNGISVTAGQSIIGSGLTIANTGVLSNVAGSGITVSSATGNVTIAQNDRETIATTTGLTISQVAFYTKTGGLTTLGGVSTTTLSAGSGLNTSATLGALLGGSNATLSVNDRDEIATTTDIAISQIAYWTKTGGLSTLASVATGTVSAGNGISLDSSVRSVIGGSLQITNSGVLSITATSPLARDTATGAVTISCPTCSSSGNIIATTSDIAVPQLAYFTKTGGNTTLGSVATGTISSANTALTVTGSRFSVGGATTFTVSTTSNNMFTGTPGQILGYGALNGTIGWHGFATTTAGTGLTYTGTAFNVNTTQNISRLSNLTSNGIVRTSGGNGTLNVDVVQPNMLLSGSNTNLVVATSTPTMGSFYATSTTATSSIAARLLIGSQNTNFYPNAPLTITGNVNNTFQTVLQNLNAGATAGTDLILGGNLMTNTTYYGNLGYNSSVNAEAGYTAFAPNDLYLYNNDASLDLATASSTNPNAHIKFFTNGTLVANERMRLTSNGLGIGTTSPRWQLQIASSTGPQIALGDLLTTTNKWTFRAINNWFFISTSSAATFATSTFPALTITPGGGLSTYATQPATSTSMTINWTDTPNQVELRIGTAATTIAIINATTSNMWGSTKRVWICNPGVGTAGTITWQGVEWIGTAPTQTTTVDQCDLYSFNVTRATSTSAYKVAGAASTGFK